MSRLDVSIKQLHRSIAKFGGPSTSAEEYPGPDCVYSLRVQASDLGEKGNYNIISQYHMHKQAETLGEIDIVPSSWPQ